MLSRSHNGSMFLFLSILVLILDQITKYLCVTYVEYGTWGIQVTPFFNIVHIYNHGAAFSILADMGGWQRWFLAAVAVVLTLVFIVLLKRTPRTHKWTCVAYALFIGGALGNLVDRLCYGYVIDFLLFYLKTDSFFYAYPAFNVADISVCVGAFLFVLITFFGGHKDKDGEKGQVIA